MAGITTRTNEAVWKKIWNFSIKLKDKQRNNQCIFLGKLQPSEERYDFEDGQGHWEMLGKNHKDIVTCNFNRGNAGLDVSEISGGGKDGLCGKAPEVWTEAKCMPKWPCLREIRGKTGSKACKKVWTSGQCGVLAHK